MNQSEKKLEREEWMIKVPVRASDPLKIHHATLKRSIPDEGLYQPEGTTNLSVASSATCTDSGLSWNRRKILNIYEQSKNSKKSIESLALEVFKTVEEFMKLEKEIFGKSTITRTIAVNETKIDAPKNADKTIEEMYREEKLAQKIQHAGSFLPTSKQQHENCWFCLENSKFDKESEAGSHMEHQNRYR